MKSWTRTLNMDDAHSLLALAHLGIDLQEWTHSCYAALPNLSLARRRELIRMLRDDFLTWSDNDRLEAGLFMRFYETASAIAQLDLLSFQWALTHPIALLTVNKLVAPALEQPDDAIPFDTVEQLVADNLSTSSVESIRKTRTVLLGALEGIGTIITKGTGQHRQIRASRSTLHPLAFGYLVVRELQERKADGMMLSEAAETSLSATISQCGKSHARECLRWNVRAGILTQQGDEIAIG